MAQCTNKGNFNHLVKNHPCFNDSAHHKFGRIHLPVSPLCNIQCRFCKRGFNKLEDRPGVSRQLLSPEKAVAILDKALELCPEITVVGIAGPGDTLATDHAIETFELVHARYPQLIKCLSTNGLLLREKAEGIIRAGVQTVTVTVNAVDPAILAKICAYIVYNGQYQTGEDAARWLIMAQLSGIAKIVKLGAVVKVNTVLIPGINDHHVEEVAQVTANMGASIINVIPLIPQNEFAGYPAPNCDELQKVREAAERHLTVFRHCRQCRADACGIPGQNQDFAQELYDQPLTTFSHG